MTGAHDAVFWNGSAGAELINMADGFGVQILCGSDFPCLTICTEQEGAACIEPWQARPDAIRREGESRTLPPLQSAAFSYVIRLRKLGAGCGVS